MDDKSKKSHTDDHHQPPSDEVIRNKINKHLSDESDTISEEDMKNINTSTGATVSDNHKHDKTEADEIMKDHTKDDDEPEKEAPTPWEVLGE